MTFRDGHELIGIANGWTGLAGEFAGHHLTPTDIANVATGQRRVPREHYDLCAVFF